MSKRYVLLAAGSDLSEDEVKALADQVERTMPGAKVIPIEGSRRHVVVKTNQVWATRLRAEGMKVAGRLLKTELTSGSIGKLKRRAKGEGRGLGEVP